MEFQNIFIYIVENLFKVWQSFLTLNIELKALIHSLILYADYYFL